LAVFDHAHRALFSPNKLLKIPLGFYAARPETL